MRIGVIVILICAFFGSSLNAAKKSVVNIVPQPQEIKLTKGVFAIGESATISFSDSEIEPLADLLVDQFDRVYDFSLTASNEAGAIDLSIDKSYDGERYTISITNDGVKVKAGNYKALAQASISLVQMAEISKGKLTLPCCEVADQPKSDYRAFMIDMARQWHDIESIKHMVDLCQWYKIRYMQLHLSDDQSFTFPSITFPQLATPGRHYTREQLEDLVIYAETRGVTLVPEFDAPGHTQKMREAMPELFGRKGLGIINIADEKVLKAVEIIILEMMEIFHTSPYFHIGADEAWLGEFQKEADAAEAVKRLGFDNAHDLYLNYMVRMHQFVKSQGKKTLIWESFGGTGSDAVKIPKDILVIAWETLYQRPDHLVDNGYTIINASWKPTYVTPGKRWEVEYIYNWNTFRWENFWEVTPAYKNPIQLEQSAPVIGGQMCAWEMSEYMTLPSIRQRLGALSEKFWNPEFNNGYQHFSKRLTAVDKKYSSLIFPAEVVETGLTYPGYEGIHLNWKSHFGDKVTLSVTPRDGVVARYTTDGSVPTVKSEEMVNPLTVTETTMVHVSLFDKDNNVIGYMLNYYEHSPVTLSFKGAETQKNYNVYRLSQEFFDQLEISMKTLRDGGSIHYTVDGSEPTKDSPIYSKAVVVKESSVLRVQYFNRSGEAEGKAWKYTLKKIAYEKNITTGCKVTATSTTEGSKIEYAVDGYVDKVFYWDAKPTPQSLTVELKKAKTIKKIDLFTYWDGSRYYQYTVEVSVDGKNWTSVVDASNNSEIATEDGYQHKFAAVKTKYIKVNVLSNSSNSSAHIVELRAY